MKNEIHLSGPSRFPNLVNIICTLVAVITFVLPFYYIHKEVTGRFSVPNENRVNKTDPRSIPFKEGTFSIERFKNWYKAKPHNHIYIGTISFFLLIISFVFYKIRLFGFKMNYLKVENAIVSKEERIFEKVIKKRIIGNIKNYNHIYFGKGVFSGGGYVSGMPITTKRELFVIEIRGSGGVDLIEIFTDFSKGQKAAENLSFQMKIPLKNEFDNK